MLKEIETMIEKGELKLIDKDFDTVIVKEG